MFSRVYVKTDLRWCISKDIKYPPPKKKKKKEGGGEKKYITKINNNEKIKDR